MLRNGHAHVWLLELAGDGPLTRDDYDVLSNEERAVASRFVRHHDCVCYVRSHVELRSLLASYTGDHPSRLRFERTREGKPYLPGSHVHFNMSHSGRCVAVGICAGSAIGVDVEEIRANPECWELARAYFAPHELAWMSNGSHDQQLTRFYQLWTIKEALVKATGAGVSALGVAVVTDGWHVEGFDGVAGYASAAVVASGVTIHWQTRSEDTPQWRSSPTSSSA